MENIIRTVSNCIVLAMNNARAIIMGWLTLSVISTWRLLYSLRVSGKSPLFARAQCASSQLVLPPAPSWQAAFLPLEGGC